MPRPPLAALALVFAACGVHAPRDVAAPAGAPTRGWSEVRADARAAYRAKDLATYADRLAELVALSGSAQYVVELAATEARLGRLDRAVERLRALADMGLTAPLDDPAFAPLADDARMHDVRARMKANLAPITSAAPAFALPKDDLIAEDVAYDSGSQRFFVTSVRKGKIVALDAHGRASDFVAPSAGIAALCGVAVHGDRLWATTADLPQALAHDERSPRATAVLAFDLANGRLVERVELGLAGKHALTDLAVAADGVVFASDALGGMLYELRPGAKKLEPVVAPDTLVSPQTAAPTADGRRVLVPDYGRGIAVVDRATHATSWLAHDPRIALDGVDGMVLDGSVLYAVQNGTTPARVVRIALDAGLTRVVGLEVLERASAASTDATHGVLVNGAFHVIANAGWARFGDDGAPASNAPDDAPVLFRIAAPRAR